MDGGMCGRGCQLPLHSTVGRMHGESCDTECNESKPMPHDYWYLSRGYRAMFKSSRRVLLGARRVLYPLKTTQQEHYCDITYPHTHTEMVDALT